MMRDVKIVIYFRYVVEDALGEELAIAFLMVNMNCVAFIKIMELY